MATINLGRVGFVQKGTYSGVTSYKINDVVVYNNGVYACISPTTGNLPTNTTYWKLWLDPSTLVAKTGDETITGVKTFSSNTIFNGNVLFSNGTFGYSTGSGGTVTQLTSKSTAVTLNKPSGQITMNNAALAAGASVFFQVNNSLISTSGDTVLVGGLWSSFDPINYRIEAVRIAGGSFTIRVTNITGVSLSEALVINFAIIKGAIA